MIAEQLPEIPNDHPNSPEWLGENWALTHLASYNEESYAGRTETSLKRSYNWTSIEGVPRTLGGRPSMTIAKRLTGNNPRITVAIEGTTSWSQINDFLSAITLSPLDFRYPKTYTTFNERARQCRSFLEGWGIDAVLNVHKSYQVVFTGHSLGAACAEILSYFYKLAYPQHDVHLVKFGSPCVGTDTWQSLASQTVPKLSFYAFKDPIYLYPNYAVQRGTIFPPLWTVEVGLLVPDRSPWRCDPEGRVSPEPIDRTFTNALVYARLAFGDVGTDNPWYWHTRNSYRWIITQMCNQRRSYERFRFRHIELPDENSWGSQYVQDAGITFAMLEVAAPAPLDAVSGFVSEEGTLTGEHNLDVSPPRSTSNPQLQIQGRGSFSPPPRHRVHSR